MSELDITYLKIHGDDAHTATEMLVAGFFALWLVDDIYTPEYLDNYRNRIRELKEHVTPESAIRVLSAVSRAHPMASALLADIERMRGLPW